MMRAHQPGSQPIDIPETIPNPAVPQPVPVPSPAPKQPVKVPAPQNDPRLRAHRLSLRTAAATSCTYCISGHLFSGCRWAQWSFQPLVSGRKLFKGSQARSSPALRRRIGERC